MGELRPFINIGPGETIKDELETLGWSQDDLARIMGMSLKAVNEIINDKTAITVDTAKLLGKAFGTSAEMWLNLDTAYRLRLHEDTEREREAERYASVMKYMPVREMVKKGWIGSYKTASELIDKAKSFWNVTEPDFSFLGKTKEPCFRRSSSYEFYEKYYALVWTQKAKDIARARQLPPYNKSAVKKLGLEMAKISCLEDGVAVFIRELEEAGIGFFVLSHLQKTYLDGAAIFIDANPFIIYTGRYDRCDNFWFTVAHELAHIVLGHVRKDGQEILDDLKDAAGNDKERAADALAESYLRGAEIVEFCTPFKKYLSRERIERCAQTVGINPGIVVGTLQYAGLLPYKNLNDYKKPVMEKIPASNIQG